MGLKVELKPNERILIGESVITNCNQRSWLLIEGASPILREKDILTATRADTPRQAHLPCRPADVHVARSAPAP
jgi:flagellar protein FlbT